MKRLLLPSALAATLVFPGVAGADTFRLTERFTPTGVGTVVTTAGASHLLLDVKKALAGAGAASLTLKRITGGTLARGTLYDEEGSLQLRLVLSFGSTAADGSSTITGTGKVITGTGAYAHARGSLRVSGTRSATDIDTVKLKGKVTHDADIPVTRSGRGQ